MLYFLRMNTRFRSLFAVLVIGAAVCALSFFSSRWQPLSAVHADAAQSPEVRNVIVLIPDGCSQSMVTLARWCRGGPLAVDRIQTGAVRTHSANSLVTDSAAAATALACGVKTDNGMLGIAPPLEAAFRPADLPYAPCQPLATVLEGAKRSGRAAGLVVTVDVWDATPAAFAAHTVSRTSDNDILEQLAHQDLDVVFGGGRQAMLPAAAGGTRTDGRNLRDELQARGVQLVGDASDMERVSTGKVWGIFAPGNLSAEIDRVARTPEQPSLAQMTATAIRLLQQNRHGFFLLVEGSQVDKAAHANDPAKAVREFLAFDDAVAAALAFATGEGQGQTLVIACPDHDTGGMTIGQRGRTPQTVADLTVPLAGMQVSADTLVEKIGDDRSAANIMANVEAWWNIRLSPATADEITNSVAGGMSLKSALGESVSRHCTAIGWTSFDHTGVDVPLWSFGPGHPAGLIDNTDVARTIARALRLDLPALTSSLFVDAQKTFPDAKLDTTDPAAPALVIGAARLPLNQNVLVLNGKEQRFEGVVVHIEKTGRTYWPQQAVNLLRTAGK
jgi:alkaline phosphatase